MMNDPEVAHHLKDFDLSKAKLVRITEPRAAYVSYRIGDRIFWTTKKLTLKKGEVILTDGTHIIRGRCGNDVSYVPMRPIAQELEFTAAQLDAPLLPPPDPALMPDGAFLSAYSSSLGTPQVPLTPPIYTSLTDGPVDVGPIASVLYPLFSPGGAPGTEAIPATTPAPTLAPMPTPEPMSFLLLSTGGIVIGVLGLMLMREKSRTDLWRRRGVSSNRHPPTTICGFAKGVASYNAWFSDIAWFLFWDDAPALPGWRANSQPLAKAWAPPVQPRPVARMPAQRRRVMRHG
jgi:hypothetical protein